MNHHEILQLLRKVSDGSTTPEEAMLKLKQAPFEDLGYAKVDLHRGVRQGTPEVIYGAGKTPSQIDKETADFISSSLPLDYSDTARLAVACPEAPGSLGHIVVATGGTSDMPVAEEAALTAEALGNRVTRLYDVGVAGLHRLLSSLDVLMSARCVVAVAGMEGALASVVGGLVDCPVIAVPTSVGYGANFGGLSALLSMLNSCASGCSVVNIDNGFGAGYLASRINQMEGLEENRK